MYTDLVILGIFFALTAIVIVVLLWCLVRINALANFSCPCEDQAVCNLLATKLQENLYDAHTRLNDNCAFLYKHKKNVREKLRQIQNEQKKQAVGSNASKQSL